MNKIEHESFDAELKQRFEDLAQAMPTESAHSRTRTAGVERQASLGPRARIGLVGIAAALVIAAGMMLATRDRDIEIATSGASPRTLYGAECTAGVRTTETPPAPGWTSGQEGAWFATVLEAADFDPVPAQSSFIIDHGIDGAVHTWFGRADATGEWDTDHRGWLLGSVEGPTPEHPSMEIVSVPSGVLRVWLVKVPRPPPERNFGPLPPEVPCLASAANLQRVAEKLASAMVSAESPPSSPEGVGRVEYVADFSLGNPLDNHERRIVESVGAPPQGVIFALSPTPHSSNASLLSSQENYPDSPNALIAPVLTAGGVDVVVTTPDGLPLDDVPTGVQEWLDDVGLYLGDAPFVGLPKSTS